MLKLKHSKRQDHEGHSYEVIEGTYEARALGGPFRDFEIRRNQGNLITVKLLRCYAEDASWANETFLDLTTGMLQEIKKKFPKDFIVVETAMGFVDIPVVANEHEIREIIMSFVLRKAFL